MSTFCNHSELLHTACEENGRRAIDSEPARTAFGPVGGGEPPKECEGCRRGAGGGRRA